MSTIKQLRELGAILNLDCGDNSCLFASDKTGMRTNGGCTCDVVGRVQTLQSERDTLRTELDAALKETP